jgi:hypothetical protein
MRKYSYDASLILIRFLGFSFTVFLDACVSHIVLKMFSDVVVVIYIQMIYIQASDIQMDPLSL